MPYDTLRFRGKYTFFLFDNYGYGGDRTCYLAISNDSFSIDLYETCKYKYHINGRKEILTYSINLFTKRNFFDQ